MGMRPGGLESGNENYLLGQASQNLPATCWQWRKQIYWRMWCCTRLQRPSLEAFCLCL